MIKDNLFYYMKLMVYLIGGLFITAMIIPSYQDYIPNKDMIPFFYYTCGFAVMYLYHKFEVRNSEER